MSKILQVSKMQQSHAPPKKGSLRSHVWSKDKQGEEAANNKANHKNTISLIVIGLKKLLFPTNSLARFLSDTYYFIGQFNKPITYKVVV